MSYLKARASCQNDKLYFVAASYDGTTTKLCVNGKLEVIDTICQSDPIKYPQHDRYAVASFLDNTEEIPHDGAIHSVSVYNFAANDQWGQTRSPLLPGLYQRLTP